MLSEEPTPGAEESPAVMEVPDDEVAEGGGDPEENDSRFYWRQSRENLLSPAGLLMFQLAYAHKDQEYEAARREIDQEYETLSPRLRVRGGAKKHGGIFATYMSLLEEMGLMFLERRDGKEYLRSTPAGDQAHLLLHKLPDVLRVVPYFILELLSRYRLNNPLNTSPKNVEFTSAIKDSDIFPYWSLYKIMREVDGTITKDELARFVFKTKRMADIPTVIGRIKEFRADKKKGLSEEELTQKYGEPLKGAIGQPKYIMGRAGYQSGVILQNGDIYTINPEYRPFIDQLLSVPPEFEELDEQSWVRQYGRPIEAFGVRSDLGPQTELEVEIAENDPVLRQVKELLFEDEASGVILVGPPGIGKTWYARQIALALAQSDASRIQEVQFHPSYQYEDFVEGYVPDGKGGFVMKPKHLLKMAELATRSGDLHVIVIDELNRTNPSRVFGEAMTYMESSLRGRPFSLASGRRMVIPANLIFLATMNPDDRSIDELDAAMDRRWSKVYLVPDQDVLQNFLRQNGVSGELLGAVTEFFVWIQRYYKLGHAFFRSVDGPMSLRRLINHQLLPLFEKNFRFAPDTMEEIGSAIERMMRRAEAEKPALKREAEVDQLEPVTEATLAQPEPTGASEGAA